MDTQRLPSGPRLSVAMIVGDDQQVVASSLRSVWPVADEMVVFDAGSTDRTAKIAQAMGAKILTGLWQDDFGAARNRVLKQVTGDWVLWLDAGDCLADDSAALLRSFLDQCASANCVYRVMVEAPPAEPAASPEQSAQIRLVPNRRDLRFEGRVRETLKPAIEAAGLEVLLAPIRILCDPRRHDQEHKARRARRNLDLVALDNADDACQVRLLLALGESAGDLENRPLARQAFAEAVRIAPRGSTEMLEGYYGLLAGLDDDPEDPAGQLTVCLEALAVYPLDAQLLSAMGNCLQARNQLALAARAFDLAMGHGQINLETWHLRDIAEVAAACLALTLQLSGEDDRATTVLKESLERHPSSIHLRRHLIDLHVKRGEPEEALAAAEGLSLGPDQREPFRSAVRGACRAAAGDWLPALGHLQSAYAAGCCDPFCLRWLCVTLLSNGRTEAALPVLRQWQVLEPNNRELQAYLRAVQTVGPAATAPSASAPTSEGTRWLRIDPGTTVTDVTPIQMPIISQTLSADWGNTPSGSDCITS